MENIAEKLKKRLTAKEEGFMQDGGGFYLFVLFLLVALSVIMQYNSLVRLTEDVRAQIAKAETIAIKGSIEDAYRRDYIARIDTDAAEDIFYQCLTDNMQMTKEGSRYIQRRADGVEKFSFTLENVVFEAGGSTTEPNGVPQISMDVHLRIPYTILTTFLDGMSFETVLPVSASNKRIVYEGDR